MVLIAVVAALYVGRLRVRKPIAVVGAVSFAFLLIAILSHPRPQLALVSDTAEIATGLAAKGNFISLVWTVLKTAFSEWSRHPSARMGATLGFPAALRSFKPRKMGTLHNCLLA